MTKPGTLLLAGSLVLNGVFGLIAWRSPSPQAAGGKPNPPARPATTPASVTPAAGAVTPARASRAPLWAGLPAVVPAGSIDDAIARLRRAGCPPREIVAAVQAMIGDIAREKRAALGYANETLPYWKSYQRFTAPRPANELSDIFLESQRLARTYLLTPELFPADEERVAATRTQFGDFDVEKLRRLAVIESEANERSALDFSARSNSTNPGQARFAGDSTGYEEIERQKAAALATVLSPAEFAEYELRSSSTASSLRYRIENLRPTEAEYKALFAVEKAFRNTPGLATLPPEQQKAAYDQYQAAMKAALSPERAADFEALQKAGGDQLPRLIARLELPLVTVSYLNGVRDQTNARARVIQADLQLTPDQRAAQLNALANEAESSIGSTLGSQRALDAYKDLKGEWLRNLRKPIVPGR